jgi:hypothetical protein
MNAAPPITCTTCSRTIGKSRTHHVNDRGEILCTRCYLTRADDNEFRWHASRAWCARTLGLWP